MNQKGSTALYVGLVVGVIILSLGIGIGLGYYSQKSDNPSQTEKSQLKNEALSQPISNSSTSTANASDLTRNISSAAGNSRIQQPISPILLKNLDINTLSFPDSAWSVFGSSVTYRGGLLDWADLNSFEIYKGTAYSKDKNGIYFEARKIDGADLASFVVYSELLSKDKDRVYFWGEALTGVDPLTFEFLSGEAAVYYFKDKNGVYSFDPDAPYGLNGLREKLKKLEGVDPETFKFFTSDCNLKWCNYYFKDKQRVFYGPYDFTEINGADPLTFEYVGGLGGSSQESPLWFNVAKDKNCIYQGNERVLDINGACLDPRTCTKDTLKTGCGLK